MRCIVSGLLGGVVGGVWVGLTEAAFIVSQGDHDDHGAYWLAALLYAVIGACAGLGAGVVVAVGGRFLKWMNHGLAWGLGFSAMASGLGLVIARFVMNKVVYEEKGVPASTTLMLLAGFGVVALVVTGAATWMVRRQQDARLLQVPVQAVMAVLSIGVGLALGATGNATQPSMAPPKTQPAGLKKQPNVLLIMVDTLRADALGAYGHEGAGTPNIDALAADGVVFEKAFSSASWTRASTASLMTSSVPSTHTCDVKVDLLPDGVTTIAEALSEQGYVTGGLPNNINVTKSFNFQQGFDYFVYQAPSYMFGASDTASQLSMYNVVRKLRDRITGDTKRVEDYYQPAETVLGHAEQFVDANKDRRWFLWVHLMEPHDPYFEHPYDGKAYGRAEHEVPDKTLRDYLAKTYAGEVSHADDELGKFFASLKAAGVLDDTLIILTADHGEEFMEHGGWWHGTTLYDEQLHVPMIVKLPGAAHKGTRVPWQVRQIDSGPTIAAATHTPVPAGWQGRDLFADFDSNLAGMAPSSDDPAVVAASTDPSLGGADGTADAISPEAARLAVIHAANRLVLSEEDFEGNVLSSIRADDCKYIRANQGNPRGLKPEELYNVGLDPKESKDLVGSSDGQACPGMDVRLKAELEAAQGKKVQGVSAAIGAAELEKMKALGYVE